jgi:hypothetical protein
VFGLPGGPLAPPSETSKKSSGFCASLLFATGFAELHRVFVEHGAHERGLVDPQRVHGAVGGLKHDAFVFERAFHHLRSRENGRAIRGGACMAEDMHRLRPAVASEEEIRLRAAKHPRMTEHVMV